MLAARTYLLSGFKYMVGNQRREEPLSLSSRNTWTRRCALMSHTRTYMSLASVISWL